MGDTYFPVDHTFTLMVHTNYWVPDMFDGTYMYQTLNIKNRILIMVMWFNVL